LHSHGQVNAI
jgi:succinyl-CoA synthetase beta subunit